MAGRPSSGITDGELRLMRVLWARGPSTVLELQAALDDDLAESTIRTLLSILVRKGFAHRQKDGRAFVYNAVVERDNTRRRAVKDVVQRFFGTPGDLVLNVVRNEKLGSAELAELKKLVQERTRDS